MRSILLLLALALFTGCAPTVEPDPDPPAPSEIWTFDSISFAELRGEYRTPEGDVICSIDHVGTDRSEMPPLDVWIDNAITYLAIDFRVDPLSSCFTDGGVSYADWAAENDDLGLTYWAVTRLPNEDLTLWQFNETDEHPWVHGAFEGTGFYGEDLADTINGTEVFLVAELNWF